MLTVVINALVQQEEIVTVITCFYYVFELTEFLRTGMCTIRNSMQCLLQVRGIAEFKL